MCALQPTRLRGDRLIPERSHRTGRVSSTTRSSNGSTTASARISWPSTKRCTRTTGLFLRKTSSYFHVFGSSVAYSAIKENEGMKCPQPVRSLYSIGTKQKPVVGCEFSACAVHVGETLIDAISAETMIKEFRKLDTPRKMVRASRFVETGEFGSQFLNSWAAPQVYRALKSSLDCKQRRELVST